jgi:putative FmdB family regulatory protein
MPTYEYACRACGHVFEIVQKMSDDPLVICPECGGELRKVFSAPAIAFKGPGFYATDHGKKKPASTESKDTKTSGGDKGDKGGDKKESKDSKKSDTSSSSKTSSSEKGSSS